MSDSLRVYRVRTTIESFVVARTREEAEKWSVENVTETTYSDTITSSASELGASAKLAEEDLCALPWYAGDSDGIERTVREWLALCSP